MVNLREAKVGDLVWYEGEGQCFLAKIKEINTFSDRANIELLDYSRYYRGRSPSLVPVVKTECLTKTENLVELEKTASRFASETVTQLEKIQEGFGESVGSSSYMRTLSAAKHAYLMLMRPTQRVI